MKKVIFIHIPKCGGTFIRSALGLPPPCGKLGIDHANPHSPHLKKIWKEYFTFTFVRNPYARLVSAYFFDKKRLSEGKLYSEGDIRRQTQNFNHSPKGFEDFVKTFMPLNFNNNRKYKPINCIIKNAKFNFIGKLENIEQDIATLNKIFYKGKRNLKKNNFDKNKAKHQSFSLYYQNTEFKEMVYNYYKKDFERFNYDK